MDWKPIYFYKPHYARKVEGTAHDYDTACGLRYTNIRRPAYVSPESVKCTACLHRVNAQVPQKTVAHIRIGVVRASRRIAGSQGSPGETLCGAPITDLDLALNSVQPADLAPLCAICAKRAKEMKQW